MANQFKIPGDSEQAEGVIKSLVARGRELRNPHATRWLVAHHYMKGARNFEYLNYAEGSVRVKHLGQVSKDGKLQFQYEEILSDYQSQLGRLLGINIGPHVSPRGVSLDGLRKSSIGQTALVAIMPEDKTNMLKMGILPPLLTYGKLGLGAWFESENSMGIEVIMPWELLPIPPDALGNLQGYIRHKLVPVDWIAELPMMPGKGSSIYSEMDTVEIPAGQIPSGASSQFQGGVSSTVGGAFYIRGATATDRGGQYGQKKKDETMVKVTEFCEVWTKTPDGLLGEYATFGGGKLLYRYDHTLEREHMPISDVTGIPTDNWWGRSYLDGLIPINIELEYAIGRLFQNLIEWDSFGVLLTPLNMGIPSEALRGSDGIKRLSYEADPTTNDRPMNLLPQTTGMWPVRTIEAGLVIKDRIANQPRDLMGGKAPGRVDSSTGLGFLYETSGVPLIPVAKSLAIGVSNCYKALLGYARSKWPSEKMLEINSLDDSIAGIVFNSQQGTMKLAENALPHPDEVVIQIVSEVPRSIEREKLELKEALQGGIITLEEYGIEVRKRGLDLPVGKEEEWQNYRRGVLENLIMFGDGVRPGTVEVSESDMHIIHLKTHTTFEARPEFELASSTVKNKFYVHRQTHEAGLGVLPDEMQTPEEAAEMAMQQQQQINQLASQRAGMPPIG